MLNKITILLFSILFISGCSPKKYSFVIDAPPKYSSEHIFKTIKIKEFKIDKSRYKNSMINMIKNGIAKEGYIKVVSTSGEAFLTGTVNIGEVSKENENNSYSCEKKIDGKKVKTTCASYTFKKRHLLKIDYSLYNARDNSVVFGDSISESFSDSWYSSDSASSARMKATSDNEIITKALEKAVKKIVYAISPHKETVSRELQEGDDDSVKLGVTYVENGRVDQALAIWGQCVAQLKSKEDRSASYYNIGVIKESQGEYRDAFNVYSKANLLMPKEELYIKAMTRAETLNKKEKKVRQWKGK